MNSGDEGVIVFYVRKAENGFIVTVPPTPKCPKTRRFLAKYNFGDSYDSVAGIVRDVTQELETKDDEEDHI